MALSVVTLASIPRRPVRDIDDLYPDRAATPSEGGGLVPGTYPVKDTGSTQRLDKNQVPTTTQDMSDMFSWEHGQVLYGSKAKANPGGKRYRSDINRAWGQEAKYRDIYVDVFSDTPVSEQLKELKDKR